METSPFIFIFLLKWELRQVRRRVNCTASGQASVQEHGSACGKARWPFAKGNGSRGCMEAACLF